MHEQGTQSQCSGTTQRDGVGREMGGDVYLFYGFPVGEKKRMKMLLPGPTVYGEINRLASSS